MNGIYEVSNPGVFAPTKRPPGCVILDVSTQNREGFYNHAAMPVTPDVTLTPSPAINLDGSDMVRMSWPDADDVIGWILERGIEHGMISAKQARESMIPLDRINTAFLVPRTPSSAIPSAPFVEFLRGDKNLGEAMRELNLDWSVPKDHTIQATPTPRTPNTTIPDVIG